MKTKTQQIEEQLGGKWKYNRHTHYWEEIDGKRHVAKVASCACDYNCGSSPRYYCRWRENCTSIYYR